MNRAARFAFALMVALGMLIVGSSDASAHTDFESSQPADGSTIDGPLDTVILDFTGTPTAIDDGIVVADAAGVQRVPVELVQDDLRITARFDPALGDGSYTLAWRVRSDDTHTKSGSFSFVVVAPIPTTSPVTATTAAAVPTTAAAVPTTAAAVPTTVPVVAVVAAAAPPPAPELLDTDDASNVTRIGRLIFFPSTVLAIGVLAFAAFAFTGRREELGTLIRLVRWLGVGVAMGALVEVVGLETLFGGFDVVLDETAGRAALARLLGGLMLVIGFVNIGSAGRGSGSSARSLSAAVGVDQASPTTADLAGQSPPWRPSAGDSVGLIGMFLVLMSFAFDGHSLSEGPRLLQAVLSIVHVASAGVWAGGVLALALVLRGRHNDRAGSSSVEMILKFSVVATFSLVLAGLVGVGLALFIDNDVASYLSTDWGRVLVVKLVLVGAAALLGAYNHFRVLPALQSAPDDPDIIKQARNTITTEAMVLVVVALVSAVLVGASTL